MSFRPFLYLPAFVFLGCQAEQASISAPEKTEILWDQWGVPHIFARNSVELFYALGWAQTHSHGNLLLRLYTQARGRAAQYLGRTFLDSDRYVHTMGIPRRARTWYELQSEPARRMLDAFTQGINDYIRQHEGAISEDLRRILPVNGSDVLAHVQRVMQFTFVFNPGMISGALRNREGGSNGWAISPSRSASGNAMLLVNPHLPWSDLFTLYEAQLVAPDVNVYGATLVGFPGLGIAFNDYLAWTHTVNTHDGADLYQLTLAEEGYLWNGDIRPFEVEKVILRIRLPDNGFEEEELVIRRSVHGPVISQNSDRALAVRVVGLDRPHLIEQYWDMARATSLAEFEQALSRLQIPLFTVIYADRQGHILHFFGGLTPVRPQGNWDWAGIVAGDTSETLWTEVHSYQDLPKVVDPASGWLQNANDPPWTTTFPPALDPEKFPPYMAPSFMHLRAQNSAKMLQSNERMTFDELVEYKHSSRMELAVRTLDDLLPVARASGSEMIQQAADVLQKWDRSADSHSRGAVLFQALMQELETSAGWPFARQWDPQDPLNTPDGLRDLTAAARALEEAAREIRQRYGSLNVAWGDVYRLRGADLDYPANGGPGDLGIFRVVNYRPGEDGLFEATGGDSFVAAVELSSPVRARALLAYGNASQPNSPHRFDQLELFSRKELRPVWRTREEIEAHLKSRMVLTPARATNR